MACFCRTEVKFEEYNINIFCLTNKIAIKHATSVEHQELMLINKTDMVNLWSNHSEM